MIKTLEEAKEWAHNRAKIYEQSINKIHFVVCKWNDGYIVHDTKFIYSHRKEYKSEEIIYCTDKVEFKLLLLTLRFLKDE